MRESNASMVAARQKPDLRSRDFFALSGRDRSDGTIHWLYVWNGDVTVDAQVHNIDTGDDDTHTFLAEGSLVAVDDIQYVCEQTVSDRTLSVTLNHINDTVNDFVRTYDLHEQKAFVYQGDFDLETNVMVAPAECVWAGVVDTAPITDGAVGSQGNITISLRSYTTELTRTNTLTRSHASEILRDPNDTFFQDTAVVSDWLTYLGKDTPKSIGK